MLRIDSTVTDTPIHAPSDTLWDSVRVLRLLQQAQELASGTTVIEYRMVRLLQPAQELATRSGIEYRACCQEADAGDCVHPGSG